MADAPPTSRKVALEKSLRFTVAITIMNAFLLVVMTGRMVMMGGGPRPALSAAVLLIFGVVIAAGVVRMRNLKNELRQLG